MPRQPNRRPKIFESNGTYHCFITVGRRPDGTLDRRHLRGKTATEVAERIEELQARVRRGSGIPVRIETVEHWLTHWLEHVVRPKRAWKTWSGYKSIVEVHLIPHVGHWRLDGNRRIEPEHVEAMYAKLRTGLSPSYVRQIHRVFSKALKDAVRRGKAGRNVCDLFDPPTARRVKIEKFALDEAQQILYTALSDPLAPRWLLGILHGLRQGECLGVRWNRLALDAQPPTLTVGKRGQLQRHTWQHGCPDPVACARARCRTQPCPPRYGHGCADPSGCKKLARYCPTRTVVSGCREHPRGCPPPCGTGCVKHAAGCPSRHSGGLVFTDPKSEAGERDVVLAPALAELLRAHREQQIKLFAEHGIEWTSSGLVFLNAERRAIDPRRDREAWKSLLVRAGVKDGRLHAARHFAGTLLIATGTDISVVQEMLGHSDIRVTRGYVEVANELKREAIERAAAALFDGQLAALLLPGSAPARP